MRSLVVFFATVAVAVRARCYYLWSRCYRWLRERGYAGHVRYRGSVDECIKAMLGFQWRADGPRQLWDAIGYPRHLEEVGEGDCDEFAVWWLDAGRNGLVDDKGRKWLPVGLLTCFGARHNVALFALLNAGLGPDFFKVGNSDRYTQEIAHASNWGWFDGFGSLDDLARGVAARMGKEPLCYSLVSPDLKTVHVCKWLTNDSNDSSEREG